VTPTAKTGSLERSSGDELSAGVDVETVVSPE
jgi:hypothetical protein